MNGHMKIMQELLAKGADITLRTKAGMEPLHVASMFGHTQLAAELIEKKADIHSQRNDGQTPLHLAVKKSRTKTVVMLVEKGSKWDALDKQKNTPLAYAAPFLLTDLWKQHGIKEAKEWSQNGLQQEEDQKLPGSTGVMPTAYTVADEGLQRTPKMEHRSPMMKYRKIGDDNDSVSPNTVGASRRLQSKPKREKSSGSFAARPLTDKLKSKEKGNIPQVSMGGTGGKIGQSGIEIKPASAPKKRFSPVNAARRMKVQWNSPANVTRRIAKRTAEVAQSE